MQGAEAIITFEKNVVIKNRIKKSYRHPELDEKIRFFRTRREAKVLQKIKVPAPKLISVDGSVIKMSLIKGVMLKEVLEKNPVKWGKEIGKILLKLHSQDIIHGDLTTSNMIVSDKLYLIDFGLSSFSKKIEDKAVDLHVLRQVLESKHPLCFKSCFKAVISEYSCKIVLEQLKIVESRGRNKILR